MKNLNSNNNRRGFLKFVTSSMITLSATLTSGCDIFNQDQQSIDQRLIQTLDHPERAREIGHVFRTQNDALKTYSAEQLTHELLQGLKIDQIKAQELSDEKLTQLLSQQIREDFLTENFVIVGQWMFSRTEAMLCALADVYQRSQANK